MRKLIISVALAAEVLTCGQPVERVKQTAHGVANPDEAEVPVGKPDNALSRARQRFDLAWRQLQSFRAQQAARQVQQQGTVQAPPQPIQFVSGVKESFKHLDMTAINSAPARGRGERTPSDISIPVRSKPEQPRYKRPRLASSRRVR